MPPQKQTTPRPKPQTNPFHDLAPLLARGSTYDFARVVLDRAPHRRVTGKLTNGVVEEQRVICDFLDRPHPKKMLLSSRGSLKSTCVNAMICRRWALDPDTTVLRGQANADDCAKTVKYCREVLDGTDRSSRWPSFYGSFKGDPWRADRFNIGIGNYGRVDNSMELFTPEIPKTGGHYDLRVMDDLHDETNTRTMETIDTVVRSFKGLTALLTKESEMLVVGTIYHENDLYMRILRGEFGDYETLVIPAIKPGAENGGFTGPGLWTEQMLNFPYNLPLKFLRQRFIEYGEDRFYNQYLLRPKSDRTAAFPAASYQVWDVLPKKLTATYITTDAAAEMGADNDFSAFQVWGADAENVLYELEFFNGKCRTPHFISEILDAAERWKPMKIGVERGTLAAYMKAELRRQQDSRRTTWPVVDLRHGGRDKPARARGVQGRYDEGGLLFHPQDGTLKLQMTEFPKSGHDDAADCVFYLPQLHIDFDKPFIGRKKGLDPRTVVGFERELSGDLMDGIYAARPKGGRRQVGSGEEWGGAGYQRGLERRPWRRRVS